MMYFILIVIQLIIDIQDGPAGLSKDGVHLLLQQALHDSLCGSDLHGNLNSKYIFDISTCHSEERSTRKGYAASPLSSLPCEREVARAQHPQGVRRIRKAAELPTAAQP